MPWFNGHHAAEQEPLTAVVWEGEDASRPDSTSIEDLVSFVKAEDVYKQGNNRTTEFLNSEALHKLGELTVHDDTLMSKLGDKPMLTMGTNDPKFDWKRGWEQQLGVGLRKRHHRHREGQWSNEVTVEAWVLAVRDAAAPDVHGMLHEVVKGHQTNSVSLSLFGLPPIQAVIDFKWKTFAKTFVMVEMAFMLLWLASFTTLSLIISVPGQLTPTGAWNTTVHVCNVLSLVGMLPFMLIEVANMWDYWWDWLGVWNVLEMLNNVLQVVFFVVFLRDSSAHPWVSAGLALQNLLLWMRTFFLARALQTSKQVSLVDIIALVVVEIRDFILLSAMLLWAFAVSFHVLFRMENVASFDTLGESLMNALKWMKAGSDMNMVQQLRLHEQVIQVITCLLLVTFQVVMAMLMMSLLVGVVNRSVVKAGQDQELKAYASQAAIMTDIEVTIPHWIEKYLFPARWYPKYLHLLRVKPSSLAMGVSDGKTWQSSKAATQQAKPTTSSAPAAPAVDTAALTKKMEQLQATLEAQSQLVQKLLAAKEGQ